MELSPEVEKVLAELFPSDDPLDDPHFDPVAYINQKFPNEQSLIHIDELQIELKKDLDGLNVEIMQLIQEQAKQGEQAQIQLEQSNKSIKELYERILFMKRKAQSSEQMVQEICKDIRSLDNAKKNLTKTITALKRLAMLMTGHQKLIEVCRSKEYKVAAALLDATKVLLQQFAECKEEKIITELIGERNNICGELRLQILEDFRDINNIDQNVLNEACFAIEELDSLREEICNYISRMVLKNYESLFAQGEDAGPEKIDRRFSWLRRTLREFNNTYKNVFPNEWNLQAMITKEFCDITAGHVTDFLEKGMIDSTQLVNILQKTIQFEHEMSKKFSASDTMLMSGMSDSGFSNSGTYSIDPSADEIRDKYTS